MGVSTVYSSTYMVHMYFADPFPVEKPVHKVDAKIVGRVWCGENVKWKRWKWMEISKGGSTHVPD